MDEIKRDFESGMAAKIGTTPAVLFGGCMTLLVVTVTFFKTRNLIPSTLKDIHSPEATEPVS
ncbi:hypothetical protein [Mucilaginibacter agri]|nr:hypothetical protein [Mucilaginibacter agri]